MFALCALVPVALLGTISYGQVSQELKKQHQNSMAKTVKAVGLTVYERLLSLENELTFLGLQTVARGTNPQVQDLFSSERFRTRFQSIHLVDAEGRSRHAIRGFSGDDIPPLRTDEIRHMQDGKTVLRCHTTANKPAEMYLIQVFPETSSDVFLAARINTDFIWGENIKGHAGAFTDILVFSYSGQLLFSSVPYTETAVSQVTAQVSKGSAGFIDLTKKNQKYSAAYRMVFTRPNFLFQSYTVVIALPTSTILQPIRHFRQVFPSVAVLAIALALLLNIFFIRKSLVPLDLLKEGISSITQRKFNRQVVVRSGDEFEELAENFNHMARQLDRQFKTLRTRSEIDRSILSSLHTEDIINTAIRGMQEIFENDSIAISLFRSEAGQNATTLYLEQGSNRITRTTVDFSARDMSVLADNRDHIVFSHYDRLPGFLKNFGCHREQTCLVLPIFYNEKPAAVITLSRLIKSVYREESILHARQVADQVAVALSNSQMVDELHSMSWGTLNAFSRAVDAKSPWTAGHSTRVAKLALKIGRQLELTDRQLDQLELAGILHDIGKIGIPAYILDKPGKLTDEEMVSIRKHPVIGARILEPIKVFTHIVPMILQHHEQYAGNGYPDGIAGTQIDLGARILSVADVFDALVSNRPYRKAMPMEKALAIMAEASGKMFDPDVLAAFMKIVGDRHGRTTGAFITDGKMLGYGT